MLQGVLFDMDGLMFDTERIGRDGWRKAAETLHIDLPEEIIAGFHRAPADLSTSILIDRLHGRPLEWDIRNGVVQRRGRQHGIPTPLSDIIVPLLAAASDGPG